MSVATILDAVPVCPVSRHSASAGVAEGPSVLAEDHRVGAFGVGKRQQLRKDVELVLVHRIDDSAYLFGFHWKESLWSANLRRLNRQTKPRVG